MVLKIRNDLMPIKVTVTHSETREKLRKILVFTLAASK